MFSFEKKALEFIQRHIAIFILVAGFLAGVILRIAARNFVSDDAYTYLLSWYDEIKAGGGLKALGTQVGNYNVLYQFIIALFTYLPIPALFAYKGLSMFFDLALALLLGYIVYRESDKEINKSVTAFLLVWLSPVVLLNSSFWSQCDSIYCFFTVLALYLLYRQKHIASFIILGVALSFKLQTLFVLPFFLFIYFYKKNFSILHFLITPAVMWVSSLPAIFAGRGIFTAFTIYSNQADDYGCLVMNYPSFVLTMAYDYQQEHYSTVKTIALVLTLASLAGWMIYMLAKKKELDGKLYLSFAILLTYTTVFFLPCMHDRYGYVYEILALLLIFKNKKTIIPCIFLQLISLITYSNFLFHVSLSLEVLEVVNFLVYGVYGYLFVKSTSPSGGSH